MAKFGDPTAHADNVAMEVRKWYEANRESWWERHSPWGWLHNRDKADNFMLGLCQVVRDADK